MRALVMTEVGKIGVVEKPIPTPGPREVLVKTTVGLLCTSDVHTVGGAIPVPDGRTLGHEAVGVVEKVGSGVTALKPGDRVATAATTPDWTCTDCQRGYPQQCGGTLGAYKFTVQIDGNMAEYFVVPDGEANLAVIPDDITDEVAVYVTDMLTTGLAGVENAELRFGDSVAIFAQGPVGLSATLAARASGAGLIIAVESRPERQDLARRFGADHVVDFTKGDAVTQILELTDGEGVDAAIEAYGYPQTFADALRATKAGGRISNIGYHGTAPELPFEALGFGMNDKKIVFGVCPGGKDRVTRLLRMVKEGRIDPSPMTTHEFTFGEVEKAFEMMSNKTDDIVKPLIRFS